MTTFYVETYGCAHNIADSERMSGILKSNQLEPVETLEQADVIIINTCTVKGPTENAFFTRLDSISKEFPNKAIIIAGCIPQSDPLKVKKYSTLGPRQYQNIAIAVEEALKHNQVHLLETGEMPPLNLPTIRKNPLIEIIPINLGCMSHCTFCKTKQARGDLKSYPIKDIVARAKQAIQEGVQEIWLTSQDTMCYGFDIKTNLANLLQNLTNLEGDFKIRVGMGNPIHFKKIKDDLITILKHPKIYQFIHLPIQAGSNKVLKDMRRGNTKEEYINQIAALRNAIPNITIATDIIVGYPTETNEDFEETLSIVKQTRPDIINISRFWPRPKTPAAKLPPLPQEITRERTKQLTALFYTIAQEQNNYWLHHTTEIIISEAGKLPNQWIGRNQTYRPIIIEGQYKIGDKLTVKITKATVFDLRAEIVTI